ncbi:MAG: hypothetical protein QXP53_02835 [Candidatus Pacearchaeota archaeon]
MRAKVSKEVENLIENIFQKAKKERGEEKAKKLIKKARKIAKHANYRIPEKWRDKFCHKCNSWLDQNVKIRLSKKKISRKCLRCGNIVRKKFK